MVAQHEHQLAFEIAHEPLAAGEVELETGKVVIADAVVKPHRVLRDRQQAAALRAHAHVRRGVRMKDGHDVRARFHDAAVNDEPAAAHAIVRRIDALAGEIVHQQRRRRDLIEKLMLAFDGVAIRPVGNAG